MIAEEGHPAGRLRVRLVQRPDQRVARIAELLSLGRMQFRDQLAGVALHALGDAAAVGLDEIHDEEIGIGIVDLRHRKLRKARKLAQHVGLELEMRSAALAGLRCLHCQAPAVGKRDPQSRQAEPNREGARLHHA